MTLGRRQKTWLGLGVIEPKENIIRQMKCLAVGVFSTSHVLHRELALGGKKYTSLDCP